MEIYNESELDFLFKIIVLGESGVGKTNILSQYINNEFNDKAQNTIGVEFFSKQFEINDFKVKVQFWDTAGQERYKSINSTYYKNINGAILVYDITNRISFNKIEDWVNDIKQNSDNYNSCKILVLGNKNDLKEIQNVNINEVEKYSKKNNFLFSEVSAKLNSNNQINDLIKNFIKEIVQEEIKNITEIEKKKFNISVKKKSEIIILNKNKKKCC